MRKLYLAAIAGTGLIFGEAGVIYLQQKQNAELRDLFKQQTTTLDNTLELTRKWEDAYKKSREHRDKLTTMLSRANNDLDVMKGLLEAEKGKYAKLEQKVEGTLKKVDDAKKREEEKTKTKLEKLAHEVSLTDISYETLNGEIEYLSFTLHNMTKEDMATLESTLDTLKTSKQRTESGNMLYLLYNKRLLDPEYGSDGSAYVRVHLSNGDAHVSCGGFNGNKEVKLLELIGKNLSVGDDYLKLVDTLERNPRK